MTFLLTVLAAIVVLGPLVALHEWGHYIVARLCGVKVLTYSIGFGPKLLSWTSKKTGINYAVSAVPLGGYVKMLDEREGEVDPKERHLAFNTQKPWKKIAIVSAGPMMNLIIAVFLYWLLFVSPSEVLATKVGSIVPNSPVSHTSLQVGDEITQVDGENVQSWQDINYSLADRMGETGNVQLTVQNLKGQANIAVPISQFMKTEIGSSNNPIDSLGAIPWQPKIPPVIGEIVPNGSADRQGLQVGDVIKTVNGQPIGDWLSFSKIVKDNPEVALNIGIERAGQAKTLSVMPQAKKDTMGQRFGQIGAGVKQAQVVVPPEFKKTIQYNPIEAMGKALHKTTDLSMMTLKSMGKMVTGLIGVENLSGPITIAKVANQSFSIGWEAVLSFMAIISLSLAVLNLLPIPVLDGGHIVMYGYEAVFGKPMPKQVQTIGMNIGLALLGCFMLLAIGNDISRLF
ncbi:MULTISPECIES: RIP metalloprotease RseP [unclassified Moraxella]|uniref:RIP metalloprotease RseP n=1 Tax=unclassified Moraxella TaxID=2685852 RepID=UPI003AF567E5